VEDAIVGARSINGREKKPEIKTRPWRLGLNGKIILKYI
jgi:hypothetical protein